MKQLVTAALSGPTLFVFETVCFSFEGTVWIFRISQFYRILLWRFKGYRPFDDRLEIKYSRLSLSRSQRDPLKNFEISVLRHIRFAELR